MLISTEQNICSWDFLKAFIDYNCHCHILQYLAFKENQFSSISYKSITFSDVKNLSFWSFLFSTVPYCLPNIFTSKYQQDRYIVDKSAYVQIVPIMTAFGRYWTMTNYHRKDSKEEGENTFHFLCLPFSCLPQRLMEFQGDNWS